jgi:hypothetical protein
MNIKDILIIVLPILAGILGSYLTYYFTIQAKHVEAIHKYKEEKYSNLIILIQGFLVGSVSGETKKKFLDEYYKSWLYCSDDVVRAINEFLTLLRIDLKGDGKNGHYGSGKEQIGNIIIAMRNDLKGKTKLKPTDFEYINVIPDNKR